MSYSLPIYISGAAIGKDSAQWLKTICMYSLTALEARRLKSRCCQGRFFLEVLRETVLSVPLTSEDCRICAAPQLVSAQPDALIFTSCSMRLGVFPLLRGHLSLDLGPTSS